MGVKRSRVAILAQSLLCALIMPACAAQVLHPGSDFSFQDCYASLTGTQLIVGNTHIRRTWHIEDGQLFATSFVDLDRKTEWIDVPSALPSPSPPSPVKGGSATLLGGNGVFGPTEATSLRIELKLETSGGSVDYEFQIFPGASGIRIWLIERNASSVASEIPGAKERPGSDALEHLQIAKPHIRLTQVTMHDRTDEHNELVQEDQWLLQPNQALLQLRGNLFFLENTLTGDGLVFLKEAPQPEMQPVQTAFDAWFSGSAMSVHARSGSSTLPHFDLSFYGHGFTGDGRGYPYVLLAYHGGGNGRIAVLQDYQRQIHQYLPGRDGQLVSNTWGDRSAGSKLNESFVRKEIDAGSALGVDIVQIDDGWQKGKSTGTVATGGVWDDYWTSDPNFWSADPVRFPSGLKPLAAYAHSHGMKLGLWFAPDSHGDFVNHRKDAARLLALQHRDDIRAFKLDSVKIGSKLGEANYRSLIDQVQNQTEGTILIDLDVTAETRQGYFGNIAAGPLFVENRYTDWHTYWPHQTLRNLWQLAHYVDPIRLRMEFLNNERNIGLYTNDPLAPARYQPSCLFAMTMFGSPLAWFENSGLSPSYVADASPVILRWKEERDDLHRGTIVPIGEAPDGVAWTGFASIAPNHSGGYLLIFRELNSESHWILSDSLFQQRTYKMHQLAGSGVVTQAGDGFHITIDDQLGFVWLKLEPSQQGGQAVDQPIPLTKRKYR